MNIEEQDFLATRNQMNSFLDKSINNGLSISNKKIACEVGCDECCNFIIPVSLMDIKHVVITLNKLNEDVKSQIKENIRNNQNLANFNRNELLNVLNSSELGKYRIRCPLLVDSKCSIYKDRPLACRVHYSSDLNLCKDFKADLSFKNDPNVLILSAANFDFQATGRPHAIFLHESFYYDEIKGEFDGIISNTFELLEN